MTHLHPAPSPDDRWLAYVSDRSGGLQVYVRPMRGSADVISLVASMPPIPFLDRGTFEQAISLGP